MTIASPPNEPDETFTVRRQQRPVGAMAYADAFRRLVRSAKTTVSLRPRLIDRGRQCYGGTLPCPSPCTLSFAASGTVTVNYLDVQVVRPQPDRHDVYPVSPTTG